MKYIYERNVESSDEEDYADKTTMMREVLVDTECVKDHVLNFKGSIRVIGCSIGTGHGSV